MYKTVSIKDANSWDYLGDELYERPMRYHFIEVKELRNIFASHSICRIQSLRERQKTKTTMAHFYEPAPALILLHNLYIDFSLNQPTMRRGMCNGLQVSSQTANNLINDLISQKIIYAEKDNTDKRTQILVPTIALITDFERSMAKWKIQYAGLTKTNRVADLCDEWDALRLKYFPPFLSSYCNFKTKK